MEKAVEQVHRILLADDDPVILKLLSKVLSDAGHTVETCPDGDCAWERINSGEFTLLVTDEEMPGQTGSQVILQLRAQRNRIPVILMSARAVMPGSSFMDPEDGFAFLKKPFTFSSLHESIRLVAPSPV